LGPALLANLTFRLADGLGDQVVELLAIDGEGAD